MKRVNRLIMAGVALVSMSYGVFAVTITPDDAIASGNDGPGNPAVLAEIAAKGYTLGSELYKFETNPFAEEGPLAGQITPSATPAGDEADSFSLDIDVALQNVYLLVKDGNNTPVWYLFYFPSVSPGVGAISGSGFWPGSGAISYVGLYGETVPDGGLTLALLGMALGTAGLFSRKVRR